jgi:hypothetical protein
MRSGANPSIAAPDEQANVRRLQSLTVKNPMTAAQAPLPRRLFFLIDTQYRCPRQELDRAGPQGVSGPVFPARRRFAALPLAACRLALAQPQWLQ